MSDLIKTRRISVWFLLLFPLLLGIARAQYQSGALSLANVAVMPNPVVAGSNVSILFQLYNSYNSGLNDVNLQLTGTYPVLNFSPSGSYLISVMGTGLYAGYFSYNIILPQTTPSGTYTLSFLASYQATSSTLGSVIGTSSMPLSFYVHGVPNVTASVTNVQVISGKEMSVSIQVSNTGYTKAKNLLINFPNTDGMTVSGTNTLEVAELGAGSTLNVNVDYNLTGTTTIGKGTYPVPVIVSYTSDYNTTYSKQINLTASILMNKPNLIALLTNPQPQSLYQGRNQSISLEIENIGTGAAKNVTVTLESGTGITLLSSVSSFFIGDLEPNQAVFEQILVAANGTSNANLIANMQYYPTSYQSPITKTQTLSLSLAPAAQFSVIGQTSTLNPGATAVPIMFVIKNTGTMEADQMQLSLQTTYPVTPVASTYFIESLKPGASTNATFVVSADSQGTPGNYPVTIYEQWKQPNGAVNQQFSGSNNYFVNISSAEGSGMVMAAVIIIIIAAIAIYGYRMKKKQNVKQKK